MSESKQYYYVYKLFHPDCPEFYIGSTKNMKDRMYKHKSRCNNEIDPQHNLKVYEYIRSNGGFDSWQFEVLEHIRNSINTKELHDVERKYIEQLKPSLNRSIPNRTMAEYRQDNKEYFINYMPQYYQDNRETIRTRQKQKFECPCGSRYTMSNKARHFKTKKHQSFIN